VLGVVANSERLRVVDDVDVIVGVHEAGVANADLAVGRNLLGGQRGALALQRVVHHLGNVEEGIVRGDDPPVGGDAERALQGNY